MKTVVKISLILNIGLIASLMLIYVPKTQRKESAAPASPAAMAKAAKPAPSPGPTPAQISTHVEPVPFRWSQLYAQDYHDYVKNLRAIGCPEATVRAIVTADVQVTYLALAKQMENQLSALDHRSSWPEQASDAQAAAALKQRLSGLPDEEAAEINDFLGVKTAVSHVAANSEAPESEPIVVPVVFQDVDLTAMNLSEDQKQAMADIRQEFLQQIGGTNQDPNDPAYLKRWQEAQPAADAQAQAMLGMEAYLDYQIKAGQKAMEKQAKGLPAYP